MGVDWKKEGWRPCEACGQVHAPPTGELACLRRHLREARADRDKARKLLADYEAWLKRRPT